MNPVIQAALQRKNAAFEQLPLAVQHLYTERQWSFLTDYEKATLIQRETEPEV